MNMVHDYEIKSYFVNFENKDIVINISDDDKEKQIVFHNFLCYKFYDEMPYSIILDLEERVLDKFFTENKELLIQGKKNVWPMRYNSLEELEEEIRKENLTYQVLYSSYGMNGWVLAERVEIIDVK
ncbi:hypothetical protein [Candidatus Enterococcus lemimoniae]|uniref:Uncharacterized protein n=1 Tax=Candidatus Enterococcus lemimoniae TaxID=1834167 RepID=A0ABZ2T7T7_9ENTE|nr:hypothetical protein [Enterococcus sp. 12C11_DIV0727]OTO68902.1 hypothetical protein A5866_001101 [Enterococcus sp. 12C11_DIV0727]